MPTPPARRVLITGATGFVGRHVLPRAVAAGWETHAVHRLAEPVACNGVTWHQVDLLDAGATRRLVDAVRPSHLLHAAWTLVPGQYTTSIDNLAWIRSSLVLLEAFAAAGGSRAVCLGTCFEYDSRQGLCSESVTPLRPTTLYGAAKHSVHIAAEAFARQAGFELVWARLFFLYGSHESPGRLMASVVRSLLKGEPARCSHGRQIRDFLHVDDVASALAAVLGSRVTGAINIASGEPIAVGEIVGRIADRLGRLDLVQFGAVPVPADDPPLIVGDIRRLRDEVGWAPAIDLDRGLEQTIRWWRDGRG